MIPENQRDIFLSHRSMNKDIVRSLAADIENITFQNRNLLTWLDEAEIRAGQSITGMVNQGLEISRFIALIMTPEYFEGESGWTDAEWHSALHTDPDNRKARIIPILAADCPYIRADGSPILPSKAEIKEAIRAAQHEAGAEKSYTPAFPVFEGHIVTFHDLQSPESPFASVINENSIESIATSELLSDAEERKLLISLLNMSLDRYAHKIGLVIDETKSRRFYFPPKDGNVNKITWKPKRNKATRTVAKPCTDPKGVVKFWLHLGAYLKIIFLANKLYLQIVPTWVLTENGIQVKTGSKVGSIVSRWTGAERNLQLLYHVRFWATCLRAKPAGQTIQVWAGEQFIEISVVPAFVQQSFGIEHDRKNLMEELDQAALLFAQEEEELAAEDIEDLFQIDNSEEEYFLEDE